MYYKTIREDLQIRISSFHLKPMSCSPPPPLIYLYVHTAVTLYLHYVRLILTYVYCKLLPSLPSLPSLPPFPPSLPLYTLPPALSSFPLLCLTPLHSPLVSFPLSTSLPSLFPLAPPFSRSGSVAGLPATLGNGGHFLWGTPAQVGGPTWSQLHWNSHQWYVHMSLGVTSLSVQYVSASSTLGDIVCHLMTVVAACVQWHGSHTYVCIVRTACTVHTYVHD